MNSKLSLIARQVERREQQQAPAPVETSGIGGAIEAVIERMVEERVAAALAEQRRQLEFNKPKPVTDYRDLPPIPRTRAPKSMECQLYRDELRRVNRISIGTMEFVVQRNEVGQVVRMVPADIAPLPPAAPPADINRGA
ncbi:hypothetical protein N5D53_10955 [Pseudomonas sp. GD03862]|uniref:hypothetical protein n=1 Tax=Pseudomonas sp. GD03862 TaxID=2975391 RepID=UPI002447BB18|nr:hypothetical protein [Pseudomonas sp. GD03862]MDH0707035.1 hypothetical protein [Pseudomonas sp. GD03862]